MAFRHSFRQFRIVGFAQLANCQLLAISIVLSNLSTLHRLASRYDLALPDERLLATEPQRTELAIEHGLDKS